MRDGTPTLPFVLMYHSVAACPVDPYRITVSPSCFAAHMRWVRRCGLRGVSMRELMRAHERGAGSRLVGLTFDDGYADFLAEAMPVLARQRFTATLFVVAGHLGGHNDWDRGGPAKPLLSVEQVREVADRGMEIGSHSMTHTALQDADPWVLKREVQGSRDLLESVLGRTVNGFSYPYGDVSDAAMHAAQECGYDYAVATWPTGRRDRHALPRTYAGQRDGMGRLIAKRIRHRLTWGPR